MTPTVPALAPAKPASEIPQILRQASARTGADFGYLLTTALRESGLDPNARAPSSSATGLFQFIEQTWLGVVKRHGAAHGLAAEAAAITTNSAGRHDVPDPARRAEILALRRDPYVAAMMAGELTAENRAALEAQTGRPVNAGELYLAHFLGPAQAGRLIEAAEQRPDAEAAALFPAPAAANRSIFYDRSGAPRSVAAVYAELTKRHGDAAPALPSPTHAPSFRFAALDRPSARGAMPAAERAAEPVAARSGAPAAPASGLDLFRGLPRQPLVLSPAVVQLLAALDPLPDGPRPTPAPRPEPWARA